MATKSNLAVGMTLGVLGAILLAAFSLVNGWAAAAFARPMMASALVAVIEVGLFLLALVLAPPLSALVCRILRCERQES